MLTNSAFRIGKCDYNNCIIPFICDVTSICFLVFISTKMQINSNGVMKTDNLQPWIPNDYVRIASLKVSSAKTIQLIEMFFRHLLTRNRNFVLSYQLIMVSYFAIFYHILEYNINVGTRHTVVVSILSNALPSIFPYAMYHFIFNFFSSPTFVSSLHIFAKL